MLTFNSINLNKIAKVKDEGFTFFSDNKSLLKALRFVETAIIPDCVRTIGHDAFYRCYQLAKVVIPNGVNEEEELAFSYCTNLRKVVIAILC